MSDALVTADTAAALRKLADRVSVAADVDPVIREELVGHLEDKLLDYTSGRLRPSEADALLLVERHLGDPGTLSDRLVRAYGRIVPPTLVDRLLVLVTSTAAAFAAVDLVIATVGYTLDPRGRAAWHVAVAVEAFRWAEPLWAAAVLAWVLARTHSRVWTRTRWPRLLLAVVAIAAAFTTPLLQTKPHLYASNWPAAVDRFMNDSIRWFRLAGAAALGGLWLWWGTRDRKWSPTPAGIVLAVWALTLTAIGALRPSWMIIFDTTARGVATHSIGWQLHGPTLRPTFEYGMPDPARLLQVASLLYVGRALWIAVRGRRSAKMNAAAFPIPVPVAGRDAM